MNTGIIASRYAEALLRYADKTGETDLVYRQAEALEKAFHSVPELLKYVESPSWVSVESKTSMLDKALGEGGMCRTLKKFMRLVISRERASYLRYILYYFRMRYLKSKNISAARLTTSVASPEFEDRLRKMFMDLTGGTLELETKTDPSLIGGFIFEVADKRIDASVSRQLSELRRRFVEKNERIV